MQGHTIARRIACGFLGIVVLGTAARGADWPKLPFRHKAAPGELNTLEQIAHSIDSIEDKILDDGTVVIKQPDVYSQSRMTLYRKNFETMLYGAMDKFNIVLSARLFRSDQAAFLSQSNLAAAAATANARGSTRAASSSNTTVVPPTLIAPGSGPGITPNGLADGSIVRPNNLTALGSGATPGVPFSQGFATSANPQYGLGIEPTVYLDELKRYQDHLNELRRINMGDDTADSAGYGLYLIRMPVSIQPGELTLKGHGAILNATLRHDFDNDFLAKTFRNLAINDLVDQLSPVIFELLRSDALTRYLPASIKTAEDARQRYKKNPSKDHQFTAIFIDSTDQTGAPDAGGLFEGQLAEGPFGKTIDRMTSIYAPITRTNDRPFPIAGTEFDNVFIEQNLVMMALYAKRSMQTQRPRAIDVRSFLRREIEASYDVVSQIYGGNDPGSEEMVATFEQKVLEIAEHVRTREYGKIYQDYRDLATAFPGVWKYTDVDPKRGYKPDFHSSLVNLRVIMCYAIAVESGLLDSQLRVDMKRVFGKDGGDTSEIDAMRFFAPRPDPAAEAKFEEYVRTRWPIITFALDPVVDQQNLADASSVKRDLQLALAFAFSTGQINFNQLTQFQRRIEVDAETIALNRTVTAFAHGNDTFGYRFVPRYQNPPLEKSNFQVITNQLIRGGPGRNYGLNNSKLEAGQRELTAVVIMPSFLQAVKMDVTGNWFPLHDPDEMEIPTSRMIEQGRKVVELQDALACIHDHNRYRPGDVQRLKTRVHQLEAMLPMQTSEIKVPYENTLGGFQLFQQGVTSLVPQLDSFQGADAIKTGVGTDLILFGKHFSIQETNVVVGGIYLSNNSLNVAGSNQTTVPGAGATAATAVSLPSGTNPSGSPIPTGTTANNFAIDIISREVLRISIPKGVAFTTILDADTQKTKNYVEIYVATPTGISNRMLVPYDDGTVTTTVTSAYTIDAKSQNLTVNYMLERDGTAMRPVRGVPADQSNITIDWTAPLGFAPRSIQVSITFTYNQASITIPLAKPIVKGTGGKYKLSAADLAAVAHDFIGEIAKIDPTITLMHPLTAITVDSVDITPDDPNIDAQSLKANGTLTITPKIVNDGLGRRDAPDPSALRASYTPPAVALPRALALPAADLALPRSPPPGRPGPARSPAGVAKPQPVPAR